MRYNKYEMKNWGYSRPFQEAQLGQVFPVTQKKDNWLQNMAFKLSHSIRRYSLCSSDIL